jgi:hypothetical protein
LPRFVVSPRRRREQNPAACENLPIGTTSGNPGQPPRDRGAQRFRWAILAEEGRYAEAVRGIAAAVEREFSEFPLPVEESMRDKLAALDDAVSALEALSRRMTLLRMVSEAVHRYADAKVDDERERARIALLFVLDELGRDVPAELDAR